MNILKYSPIGHQKDRNIDHILIYLLSYHLSFKTEYDYIKLPYIELCLITYLVSSGLEAVFKKIDPGYFFHIPGPPWFRFEQCSTKKITKITQETQKIGWNQVYQ